MGRPRISDERRIATAVRLPESVHTRLHTVAGDRDVSANLLVTKAVTEYLDRMPNVETTQQQPSSGPTRQRGAKMR